MQMDDTTNDRTIGRTNVASRGGIPSMPSSGTSQPSQDAASVIAENHPATSMGAAITWENAGSVGTFEWPTSAEHYQLINRVGQGAFASVWRARLINNTGKPAEEAADDEGIQCAIKIMDLEHVNINISDIRLEVQTMRLSSHPNILVCHTSFIKDTHLWLVTQLMTKGSSLHCLQSARAKILTNAVDSYNQSDDTGFGRSFRYKSDDSVLEGGLTAYVSLVSPETLLFETHITYICYETLLGLKYIHDNGQIHRDIKAGNLLLDEHANVRIADFGVSSWLIDGGNRREHTTTFVGTPCWMAPEVMEQIDGYDYKADIWSLGITALELCKGYAPYAKYAPMKVLLRTIQEDPPSLETYNDGDDPNMWSKSFRSMVKMCLQKDPSKRPTCQELLAHKHFRPLASEGGRAEWRQRTKQELCDVVEDVGKLSGNVSSSENLPGAIPVQVVASLKKDRPAGTSWILPGGSSVDVTAAKHQDQSDGQDFFDQFEQQTGGENFVREDPATAQHHGNIASVALGNQTTTAKKQDDEEDDMNDFFDEFEKATRGENFRRDA
eukprot:CCRYP_007533-RA/>CCRYP_007533-RA protein AED:0.07 eAED:0.07 QI:178/1/1/1/0.75/0.6/5/1236/552